MTQLKMWRDHSTWEDAEKAWDDRAKEAKKTQPIKNLDKLPNMVGITPETAKNLKWKSLKWMVTKDHNFAVLRGFMRHPFRYGWRYIKSLFQSKPYRRDGDFFYYGIKDLNALKKAIQSEDCIFVLGFSYCHKPLECPSGRFTDACQHDVKNPVCQQCFIGKVMHAAPEKTIKLAIPTIHYIGEKIFEIVHAHPDKRVYFLITACEMTLEMFGDWGNMVDIRGVGVRLDGRICNTMKAFELSERGVKPGLTVVLEDTQKKILNTFRS